MSRFACTDTGQAEKHTIRTQKPGHRPSPAIPHGWNDDLTKMRDKWLVQDPLGRIFLVFCTESISRPECTLSTYGLSLTSAAPSHAITCALL